MTTTILRFEHGSRAYGTNTEDSDHDYMSIVVESPAFVTGLEDPASPHLRTAAEGVRSTSADTDEIVYPLRKWARLAAKGNPTVLTALFAPSYDVITSSGELITDAAEAFISKAAGEAFLGYMRSQRAAMEGLRNKRTNRPELISTHGYDTKFANHMLRLGYQGIELMNTGQVVLPLREPARHQLRRVRAGQVSKDEALALATDLEDGLRVAIGASRLPEQANRARINHLLHTIYTKEWA